MKRILPPAFWSRDQAPITNASFTDTHQISSTPLPFSASKFWMKLGTCLAEQVGVKAPGSAKTAIFLPFTRSSTLKVFGPTVQPLPSTSMNSCNVPAGSLSPTLIVIYVSSDVCCFAKTGECHAREDE